MGSRALLAFALALVPVTAAAQVDLRVRVASVTTVHVGDALDLHLTFENRGPRPVEIIGPVYGSWEHARQPAYDVELRDAATGNVVEHALGYEEGLSCGTLDPIRPSDRVTVPARGSQRIAVGHGAQRRVLPSARPGRYALRVRYQNGPLDLWSNPVTITVASGDLALWRCRRDQLAALRSFRAIQSRAVGVAPLPGSPHALLVFTRHVHEAATDTRTTQLWAVAIDDALSPVGGAERLFEAGELGYPPALAATSRGVLVAAIHDARGQELPMLREVRWRNGRLAVGPERRLPRGGGMGLRLSAHGDRAWLLQGSLMQGPLRGWRLDASGAPVGGPIEVVPPDEHTGDGWIEADATGAWVVHRLRAQQRLQAIRLDASGAVASRSAPLEAGGNPVALRAQGNRLHVTWQDNGWSGGDAADDGMGLRHAVFATDGRLVSRRALSPIDRSDPRWGRAAWSGGRLGFAFAEERGRVVFGTGATRTDLATTGAEVEVAAWGDGWVLAWDDRRDDHSQACTGLSQCVSEVYVARVDAGGRVTTGATRITHDAAAAAPRPSTRDWQRLCPGSP